MKKILIALLLLAMPIALHAADATVASQRFFNVGPYRACTATVVVTGAQSTGYTLSPRSFGLNSVVYFNFQVWDDSDVALYHPTWDITDSLLKVYHVSQGNLASYGDSLSTLVGTPTSAITMKAFVLGN